MTSRGNASQLTAKWSSLIPSSDFSDPPLDIPQPLWRILNHRGYTSKSEIEGLVSPKLSNLSDPLTIVDMEKAVQRLVNAYRSGDKITIYADFDLDGTSGLALLQKGLEGIGYLKVDGYQPSRLKEGYGLHPEAIDAIKESGANLVVSIDVGITSLAAAERAKELNIDLVITDHHQPGSELPNAYAVVNPNRKDCSSGLGHLSGAGVAYFLFLGVRRALREEGLLSRDINPKSLLEFFTIGTVTDLVPMKGENRSLVKHGLNSFLKSEWPGIRTLMSELGLSDRSHLTTQDIGISFAPKLNALSRMEMGLLPIDILRATVEEAPQLVSETLGINQKRKSLQKWAEEKALESAVSQYQSGFILIADSDFHKGVVGLVAIKLALRFGVPAFVGAISDEGTITGSARVPNNYQTSLLDILKSGEASLQQFGGHKEAAGFKLDVRNLDTLRDCFQSFFDTATETSSALATYDTEVDVDEIDPQLMRWLTDLEPFGKGFEYPVFKIQRGKVRESRVLKGGHIKFKISGERRSVDVIFFSPPTNLEIKVGESVEVLGELQWNEFRGKKNVQIVAKDVRRT